MIQIKKRQIKVDWKKIKPRRTHLYKDGTFSLVGYILCHCYGMGMHLLNNQTLPLYVSVQVDEEIELLTETVGIREYKHWQHTDYMGRICRAKSQEEETKILQEEFEIT